MVHADVYAQTLTHHDHTIAFLAMFMEEAAPTEVDESQGVASGAESEQVFEPVEGPEWAAASSPRHLSTDLEPLHLPLATSAPNVPQQCTPANLLPSALRIDHPDLNFPPHVKRRRVTGKTVNVEVLGTVLHSLQNDSSSSLEPWTPSWRDRRSGYWEYLNSMKQAVGLSKRDVLLTARGHWDSADLQTKSAWGFVHYLRRHLYITDPGHGRGALTVRTRIPLPAGVRMPESPDTSAAGAAPAKAVVLGKGIGIMRTFNTDWHNQIPELTDILSSSSPLEEKMHALKQLPFLQDKFAAYEQHVRDYAARHALPLWGCCFEVSLKSKQAGRIHTHDYVGPSLDSAGYDVPKRVIEFKESDRAWDDMLGFHSLTSARGNVQSKKMRAVAAAMYYVTSEKIGSLFTKCVRSPFEECLSVRQVWLKSKFLCMQPPTQWQTVPSHACVYFF